MKMLRMTKDEATFDQMATINSLWPGIRVTQINRKPDISLKDYIKDFDAIAWDCRVCELDLSDNNGDVLKFLHDIMAHSDFIKRGGILVQLVQTPVPATDSTPATVVYSYNHISRVVAETTQLTPITQPPKLDLEEEDKQAAEQGEVVQIEGDEDSSLQEELKNMPEEAKDKGDKK